MSLKDAYLMAHSAQCRLQMAASEPDRNLRFVVGHLMHYESVRLRIVEIEHDISKSERASKVAFQGAGVQKKPSTGQLGRRSPPPAKPAKAPERYDPGDDEEIDDDDPWSGGDDDDEDDGLGLQRFPSGSARPPRPPPDLLPDDGEDDDDDYEPVSPEEPDRETLENAMKGEGSTKYANLYDGIRQCPCHEHQDAPSFEKFWELPPSEGQKEGVTRVVAQVYG